MIECTSEYIYYKKGRKIKPKRFFAFFCAILIIVSLILYYKYFVSACIINICSEQTYAYSTEAVNVAVLNELNNDTNYSNLITVEKNSVGDIVLISANSQKINQINRKIADETLKILKAKLNLGTPIPILAFTGIDLLSGIGKRVYFKTINVSSVICQFNSTFNSVGINQTLHSIYIDVICEVNMNIPLSSIKKTCTTQVLISEAVLVGKVPEIYLNGKIFG